LLSVTSRPLFDGTEQMGCVAIYRDISDARAGEREVQESEQRLRVLSEASFEGVAITRQGVVLDTNSALAQMLGWDAHELIGMDGLSLFAPEDHPHVLAVSAQSGVVYEAQMLRKDASRVPVEVRGASTTFRGEAVRIAVVRDVTERRQREAELKRQAELLRSMSLRDELTGLYNRRGFQEHAQQQLRSSARTKQPASLFFIDLNGMKNINDTLGHEAGDRALVATARLLQLAFREADVVARLGGDEFAVMAAQCGSVDVAGVIERLEQQARRLNDASNEPFRISFGIGSAIFDPGSPLDLAELTERADQSMYEHKRAQKLANARKDRLATG
jgi:diguanylate cyclase (GGDEF)-like protein/PAS domain S-box-containing protein